MWIRPLSIAPVGLGHYRETPCLWRQKVLSLSQCTKPFEVDARHEIVNDTRARHSCMFQFSSFIAITGVKSFGFNTLTQVIVRLVEPTVLN